VLYGNDHKFQYSDGAGECRQSFMYAANPSKRQRIYTVDECPNSMQENPLEETLKSMAIEKRSTYAKLKTLMQQLFIDVRMVTEELRE